MICREGSDCFLTSDMWTAVTCLKARWDLTVAGVVKWIECLGPLHLTILPRTVEKLLHVRLWCVIRTNGGSLNLMWNILFVVIDQWQKKNYCQRWKSPIREQLWFHRKTKYLLSNHCSPQNEARYSGAVRLTYSIYLKRNESVSKAVDYDLWKIDHTESLNTMKAKCDASQSIE